MVEFSHPLDVFISLLSFVSYHCQLVPAVWEPSFSRKILTTESQSLEADWEAFQKGWWEQGKRYDIIPTPGFKWSLCHSLYGQLSQFAPRIQWGNLLYVYKWGLNQCNQRNHQATSVFIAPPPEAFKWESWIQSKEHWNSWLIVLILVETQSYCTFLRRN